MDSNFPLERARAVHRVQPLQRPMIGWHHLIAFYFYLRECLWPCTAHSLARAGSSTASRWFADLIFHVRFGFFVREPIRPLCACRWISVFFSLVQFCHSENLKLLQSSITCRAVLSGILLFLVRIDCNRFCLFATSVNETQGKRHDCFFDTRLSVASLEMIDVVRTTVSEELVFVKILFSFFIWSSSCVPLAIRTVAFTNENRWRDRAECHRWITAFNALHRTVTVSRNSQNSIVVFSAVAHTI